MTISSRFLVENKKNAFSTSRFHNFGTKLKLENKTDIYPAGTLLAIDIPTFKANSLTCDTENAYIKR